MKNRAKVLLTGLAGILLLIGASTTYALWHDDGSFPTSIITGRLTFDNYVLNENGVKVLKISHEETMWQWVNTDGTPFDYYPGQVFQVFAGTQIHAQFTLAVEGYGDNFEAQLLKDLLATNIFTEEVVLRDLPQPDCFEDANGLPAHITCTGITYIPLRVTFRIPNYIPPGIANLGELDFFLLQHLAEVHNG